MYNNLLNAVKTRIMYEVEQGFAQHPSFSEKVKVQHKFSYDGERPQFSVILKNSSASLMRMSADNFLSDLTSHVRMCRAVGATGNPGYSYPGLAIEWIRENEFGVTKYTTEDVSSQLSPTQRMFTTPDPIVSGDGNTYYADNVGQVNVTLNGVKIYPEFLDGKSGVVLLSNTIDTGDVVKVSYWKRTLIDPGFFVIDFVEDNRFVVAPIFTIDGKVLIEKTNGTETVVSLGNTKIFPGSEMLYLVATIPGFAISHTQRNGSHPFDFARDVDYTINNVTGEVTFLSPLPKGMQLQADYRYQPTDYYNGPYTANAYQEVHNALPGVVIAIGKRAKKGDRQIIIVSQFRETQAKIFGGHWEMSLEFSVIAKDPMQMSEMADHMISWLWGTRKSALEFEGITLISVEPSGESEEPHVEATGDLYYTTSVSVNLMTEWQEFVPYLYKIKRVIPNFKILGSQQDYKVTVDETLVPLDVIPDDRRVVKYPTLGYEKLT